MDLFHLGVYTVTPEVSVQLINPQRARIEIARSEAVFAAQMNQKEMFKNGALVQAEKKKADWILFIDSDARFPMNVVPRLLAHKKEIVGCNALKRDGSNNLAIQKDVFGKRMSFKVGGLRQVKYIGMHVTLIHMSVFEKLTLPYFAANYEVGTREWRGEDYWFCWHARQAGYQVWCDMDLSREIGHLGEYDFRYRPEQKRR
jgi:hypothetical protein